MRVYSNEFRMQAVRRILDGERISEVAAELGLHRKLLYEWVQRVSEGGEAALRSRGRPRKTDGRTTVEGSAGPRRVAELERMVGRQQMVIEFFRLALRHIEESRRRRRESGVTASSGPSRS
jgi:transposase